ncbi:hypothetical protein [Paraliobacillus salinarum]|uniref:hypothetical protein n=1 Tax=Paraliobacillus salinarum TaxID=1158996 RepID=UPI001FE8B03B|nr:hypothetical protein [Paraliobacillus salinarum]
MKKIVLILFSIMLVGLVACSDESSKDDSSNKDAEGTEQVKKEEDENVEVDKNLLSVEITMPASMVESIDQSIADAEEEGLKVKKNDDGSLTYKMSKAKHKKLMHEYKDQINQSMEEMTSSGDFPSIQDIEVNKDFSKFTMIVDQEKFENSFDGLVSFTLGISGMFYQLFDGVSPEDYDVTIDVKNSNGEVLDTINYPEDMETAE